MPTLRFLLILTLLVTALTCSSALAASPPRMRPYSGIGLLLFSQSGSAGNELQLPLYEEPGLSRIGVLNSSRLPGNAWIFGTLDAVPPLIVSARRGGWLRVFYDDAGREAWIDPRNKGHFQTWEQFMKQQTAHLLPGLQPRYYRLQQQPGGKQLATLTAKQVVKLLKTDNTWGMVMASPEQIGWLRWCDDDGRLLMGFSQ
ncbi:MAG: hypothetical protein PHF56_13920 [Desulfuromonadaceae bacterium]|nr:hypothetical protein [Desulfuromonadaceae bacterium]